MQTLAFPHYPLLLENRSMMPQTVLSSPFQHAVLLHVSMFLYSPSSKCLGLCPLKTSCAAACILFFSLCQILRWGMWDKEQEHQ